MSKLSPVKLTPAFKDYLWGGTKLKTQFNKKSDLDIVAESWELSAHKDGESVITNGEYKGMTLTQYIAAAGDDILGVHTKKFDYFPILIKFIDACGNLSVQVHPNDEYALANEGEYGKTEMWYVLDCEKDAYLYYGFAKDVTKEEYEAAIKNNTLTEILNKVPVHKGDVFFIPSGTVHAICAGIVICEIQQNSNTTYRVYDYDRRDKNGNPRQLHIAKAVDVSTLTKAPCTSAPATGSDVVLAECDYFTVRKVTADGKITLNTSADSFLSIIVTDGNGELSMNGETLPLAKGDSIFIPAQDGSFAVTGSCELILSYV